MRGDYLAGAKALTPSPSPAYAGEGGMAAVPENDEKTNIIIETNQESASEQRAKGAHGGVEPAEQPETRLTRAQQESCVLKGEGEGD